MIGARLVRPERVKTVYLGAPVAEFSRPRSDEERAAIRRELGAGPDDVVIATVTRLHDSKGNEYLVEAAGRVLDVRPRARFYLFGEGPLRPALEAQAARLGLGDRFVFGGFVRDVARLLSVVDISVFPSLWEGTPLTVFEALAAARPIVATDADGLVDVLTADRDALIVPRRDSAALAGRITALIDDPAARERLGAQARLTARQYDIETFVAKMGRLYDVLNRYSRSSRRQIGQVADLSFLTENVPT